MKYLKILITFILTSLFYFTSYSADTQILTATFLDIDYSLPVSESRIKIISSTLNNIAPDIIVLAGVKDIDQLHKLQKKITGFKYSQLVDGPDKKSHLAYLSKEPPKKFKSITDQTYIIKKGIPLPVQRGFLHAIVEIDNYKLHILGADLKSQEKDPLYNQTDMRRYEARKIRQIATQIIKEEKNANILLLANLNDSFGKSAVKTVYNRRFGIPKRLFDLRPTDKINVNWTFFDSIHDEYQRYDYAIVSSPLIPEVILNSSKIYNGNNWQQLSTHRPISVTISCKDKPLWTKDKLKKIFPNAVYQK